MMKSKSKVGRAESTIAPRISRVSILLSSPVAADDKVFLIGQGGQVSVLKAAGDWEVLKVNELDDESFGTPAIADGRIYVRCRSAMYAFGRS